MGNEASDKVKPGNFIQIPGNHKKIVSFQEFWLLWQAKHNKRYGKFVIGALYKNLPMFAKLPGKLSGDHEMVTPQMGKPFLETNISNITDAFFLIEFGSGILCASKEYAAQFENLPDLADHIIISYEDNIDTLINHSTEHDFLDNYESALALCGYESESKTHKNAVQTFFSHPTMVLALNSAYKAENLGALWKQGVKGKVLVFAIAHTGHYMGSHVFATAHSVNTYNRLEEEEQKAHYYDRWLNNRALAPLENNGFWDYYRQSVKTNEEFDLTAFYSETDFISSSFFKNSGIFLITWKNKLFKHSYVIDASWKTGNQIGAIAYAAYNTVNPEPLKFHSLWPYMGYTTSFQPQFTPTNYIDILYQKIQPFAETYQKASVGEKNGILQNAKAYLQTHLNETFSHQELKKIFDSTPKQTLEFLQKKLIEAPPQQIPWWTSRLRQWQSYISSLPDQAKKNTNLLFFAAQNRLLNSSLFKSFQHSYINTFPQHHADALVLNTLYNLDPILPNSAMYYQTVKQWNKANGGIVNSVNLATRTCISASYDYLKQSVGNFASDVKKAGGPLKMATRLGRNFFRYNVKQLVPFAHETSLMLQLNCGLVPTLIGAQAYYGPHISAALTSLRAAGPLALQAAACAGTFAASYYATDYLVESYETAYEDVEGLNFNRKDILDPYFDYSVGLISFPEMVWRFTKAPFVFSAHAISHPFKTKTQTHDHKNMKHQLVDNCTLRPTTTMKEELVSNNEPEIPELVTLPSLSELGLNSKIKSDPLYQPDMSSYLAMGQ